MKVLVKSLSLDKSYSYVDIYSLLHWIFDSLRLIYYYNFFTFIQSHNIYSWHHIRWIFATPISSGYHFLGVYRSNPFVSNLMPMFESRFYVDVAYIPYQSLRIKQIVSKYFPKIFGICRLILVKRVSCRSAEVLVLQI